MQGQLDMFSFTPKREPPVLLSKGQVIFLVNKAEVIKCRADNENSWICGGDNRGYRLVKEDGGYDVTWNTKILRKEVFADYESARAKADEYLKTHDGIILAENIKPIHTAAYSYIRDCDKRELTAFYCDLGNEKYYIKGFMTYAHISSGKRALKEFMEQQEFQYGNPKEISGFVPHFKNMYKCTEQSDWDYAEYGYAYAIG